MNVQSKKTISHPHPGYTKETWIENGSEVFRFIPSVKNLLMFYREKSNPLSGVLKQLK